MTKLGAPELSSSICSELYLLLLLWEFAAIKGYQSKMPIQNIIIGQNRHPCSIIYINNVITLSGAPMQIKPLVHRHIWNQHWNLYCFHWSSKPLLSPLPSFEQYLSSVKTSPSAVSFPHCFFSCSCSRQTFLIKWSPEDNSNQIQPMYAPVSSFFCRDLTTVMK